YGQTQRPGPRHPRPPHPEDAFAGAQARLGDCQAHPAGVAGGAAGAAGVALPGAAPPRAAGLDPRRLAFHRDRPPGEVLLAHPFRPPPAREGAGAVGAAVQRRRPRGEHGVSESRTLDRLRLGLRSLFARRRVEAELQAELDLHVEMQTAEYVAAGVPPREARERALRLLGARGAVEEECRDTRRTRPLETFLQDLRYGVRALRWNPLFAAMAALSLSLGIGANTAIFSLAHALLLRPLPVERPA